MKESRFQQVYRGLTPAAKKVYSAVPIDEEWPMNKIMSELHRLGSTLDYKIVEACLNQMREARILHRNSKLEYTREPVEARTYSTPPEEDMSSSHTITQLTEKPAEEVPAIDPLTMMSAIANRAEVLALKSSALADEYLQFKQDIENCALAVAEFVENDNKELAELRQLRATLKNFIR